MNFCLISRVCALVAFVAGTAPIKAQTWSLQDCINYALQHNVSLRKTAVSKQQAMEDYKQSRSALLPTVQLATNHNLDYRPWQDAGMATVANGYVQNSIDRVAYNGSYGINASWTVWNGNRNHNLVKSNKLQMEKLEADYAAMSNNLQERIYQLYIQILYAKEALTVSQQLLTLSTRNEERGKTLLENGKLSKAELAQLTAQRAQDQYLVVAAEGNIRSYIRDLKQLLQIVDDAPFDISTQEATEEEVMQNIGSVSDAYTKALLQRPEYLSASQAVKLADVQIKIAKSQRLPTLTWSAAVGTNTSSLNKNSWGTQIKSNYDMGTGLTLSIPLFDNRQAKTNINKAILQRQDAMLELEDQSAKIRTTLEKYWTDATVNEAKYVAAKANVESQQMGYELLMEQFKLGMKNTVELLEGQTKLAQARQNELESKYLTLLNKNLFHFYSSAIFTPAEH